MIPSEPLLRVGLVCPYSFDVPGGVQFHIRDLAEHLIDQGHHVSVLAPADDDTPLPPYVESAGRAVPLKYNGSVARISFGPVSSARVKRWLSDGDFDILHVHEPSSPSLSMLAMWAADGPIVATFHTSNPRSRAMIAAYSILQAALEKITWAASNPDSTDPERNLLKVAIDAARAKASVGEISDALEKVFGRYTAQIRTISGVYNKETGSTESVEISIA